MLMVLVVVEVRLNREDAAPVMKLNQSEISLNFKSLKNQTKTQEKIKKCLGKSNRKQVLASSIVPSNQTADRLPLGYT